MNAITLRLTCDEMQSFQQMITVHLWNLDECVKHGEKIAWYIIYGVGTRLWKAMMLRFAGKKSFRLTVIESYALHAWLNSFILDDEYSKVVRAEIYQTIDKKLR